ncbi:putative quinol monooxygenase [Lewinella sp. IMCC34183]|uniref:putative quinol monooxygenase n=1 Tax=Lewinella sp. IMCC34183 TaxID=2248762 RepID=UPI000E2402A2|nr:putative quinol monooxygenase [Lewinella sp. IMCC34183]
MSKQLYLTAKFNLDKPDEVEPIFREHAKASRAKEGCLFFYLIRDRDNDAHFATMECWDTYAHFEQHVADDEHTNFQSKLKPHLKGDPEVMEGDLVSGMEG